MPEILREKDGKFVKGRSACPGGRGKGSLNQRTRTIAERAIAEGITPLEAMLKAMRMAIEMKDWDNAAKYAAMAAPYIHPRLAAVAFAPAVASDKPINTTSLEFGRRLAFLLAQADPEKLQ